MWNLGDRTIAASQHALSDDTCKPAMPDALPSPILTIVPSRDLGWKTPHSAAFPRPLASAHSHQRLPTGSKNDPPPPDRSRMRFAQERPAAVELGQVLCERSSSTAHRQFWPAAFGTGKLPYGDRTSSYRSAYPIGHSAVSMDPRSRGGLLCRPRV